MTLQVLNIVFSIILLPVNVFSAFWMFREALNLTDMTFGEFVEKNYSKTLHLRRHRQRRLWRILTEFFYKNSSDPEKSLRLTKAFGFCTLPGITSLSLAVYCAIDARHLKYAFIGNIILIALNIAIIIRGKIYRKNSSVEISAGENLRKKERYAGKKNLKNIVVYSLVGIFLVGILLFFMMGITGIFNSNQNSNQSSYRSAISIQADLITILNEKGFETANVPTTYWEIDENKLEHVAAGVKGNSKFEFYGYSDSETVDSVYNRIIYLTAPNMENSERESHEVSLSDGNKIFTASVGNVYYLVMYRNDTVIYAYSHGSLNEINEILTEIGYSDKK